MLGGPELTGADGRVALWGELGRQPGNRAAKHMPWVGHRPSSRRPPREWGYLECSALHAGRHAAQADLAASSPVLLCAARYSRSAWRPRWIRLRTVPSFTPSVAPISS